MRLERYVDIVKNSRLEQADLSSSPFFSRRPNDHESPRQRWKRGLDSQSGAHSRHRDQIVAAPMADFWQGVIFRKNRHRWTFAGTALECRSKGSLDTTNAAFHDKSLSLKSVG